MVCVGVCVVCGMYVVVWRGVCVQCVCGVCVSCVLCVFRVFVRVVCVVRVLCPECVV